MSTPKTIYLIPGEYEEGLVWCDDPAPDSYSDPSEAVKYVRADHIPDAGKVITDNSKVNAELIAENERLQAQVAAQQSALNSICTCSWGAAEFFDVGKAASWMQKIAYDALDEVPSTEAFILRKQAEAVQASRQEGEPIGFLQSSGVSQLSGGFHDAVLLGGW